MRNAVLILLLAAAANAQPGVVARNVQTVAFQSESLGEQRNFNILLPPDYEASTRRYPVLYLLHGYGDDHMTWTLRTNLTFYATRHRMIIVMPDGSRSFYVNSAADPKARFEDFVMKDLIGYVDSHYRTIPLAKARAVAGLSMGGYGAAFLGLKHFRSFAALGSFSGALGHAHNPPRTPANPEAAKRSASMQAVFGPPGSQERADRDPFLLVEKVPMADMPLIYISCGGQDSLLAANRDFVKLLGERKIPYEYREISPRIHEWETWDEQIPIFLNVISRLPGFRQAN